MTIVRTISSKYYYIKTRYLYIALFSLIAFNSYSGIFISVSPGGNWTNVNTWEEDSTFIPATRTPQGGDTVIIKAGDIVQVTANLNLIAGGIMLIQVEGTLEINGASSQLRLAAGSGVLVVAGGTVIATGGGGATSKRIRIGPGPAVWDGGDPPLVGPTSIGTVPTFPLPVIWTVILATEHNDGIHIEWLVTESSNASVYFIQRSLDLQEWQTIGSVEHIKSINQIYKDNSHPNGRLYYRIKAEDEEGKISFSPLATINVGLSGDIKIFPNPTSDFLYVEGNSIENEEIKIHDNSGRFYKVNYDLNSSSFKVDISTLKSGGYFLSIGKNHSERSFHFIVK